jgi:hypothetical protein
MDNALDERGEYVHDDKVFPGVFVVVTSPHAGVRSAISSSFEPGFGGTSQQWGPNWALFRPYHLACVEVPMSVARAIVHNRPTGDLRGGPVADLIAVAKRDLAPGEQLDGEAAQWIHSPVEGCLVAPDYRQLVVAREQVAPRREVRSTPAMNAWRSRRCPHSPTQITPPASPAAPVISDRFGRLGTDRRMHGACGAPLVGDHAAVLDADHTVG